MRHLFLMAALAAFPIWAGSCQALPDGPEPERFGVVIRATLPLGSRVSDPSPESESYIAGIQVFVFDGSGLLEASAAAASLSLSLRCRTGEKTVWVLANAPELASVSRIADLESAVSRLSDNAPARLVMAGSRPLTVLSDMSGAVTVERLCAKVTVGSITKAFTSSVLQAKELRIRRIYMTNVTADRTYGTATGPSAWYNRMGYQGDCPSLLCDEIGQVADPTLPGIHTFYVYPNDSESEARGAPWSPRHTRLVIDATLGGEPCYYVIDIPQLESNHAYELSNIILTRPGASDEEGFTTTAGVRFTFRVKAWSGIDPYVENL